MSSSRTWTKEEIGYLQDKWGEISIPSIAKRLERTVNAVKLKAGKLGLGRHLHAGEEITFCQLCQALGQFQNYQQHKKSWIQSGLPVKYKKSIQRKFLVIHIDAFWRWAEGHKNLLDFSTFPENMLGKEPSWVVSKRRADLMKKQDFKTTPWTPAEDHYFLSLLEMQRYGYRELAIRLKRTEGAIKRRCIDLGTKLRPVRKSPHDGKWKPEQIEIVKKLYLAGYKPDMIARYVEKSALAIRGVLERLEAKGLLSSQVSVPQKKKSNSIRGSYKTALPPEQWPLAERFLRTLQSVRDIVAKENIKPDIDLGQLQEYFAKTESEMTTYAALY
jgi:hypothetical protein